MRGLSSIQKNRVCVIHKNKYDKNSKEEVTMKNSSNVEAILNIL